MLRPYLVPGVYPGIVNPTLTGRPSVPLLRLPLPSRGVAPGAVLAVLVHASVIGALLLQGGEPATGPARSAAPDAVNFFVLSRGTPASVDVALAPHVPLADLSGLRRIAIELPPVDLPRASLPLPVMPVSGGTGVLRGRGRAGRVVVRRRGPGQGLERATKAVTFFTPRRGRRFCRPWRRCPAQWPAAPCGCRSGWRPTDASLAWQWTPRSPTRRTTGSSNGACWRTCSTRRTRGAGGP